MKKILMSWLVFTSLIALTSCKSDVKRYSGSHYSPTSAIREETNIVAEPVEPEEPDEPVTKYKQCPLCAGTMRCGGCGGSGMIYSVFYGNEVGEGRMVECSACDGTGACGLCNGTGYVEDLGF